MAAIVLPAGLPAYAAESTEFTLPPFADETYTQVSQDGPTAGLTTLATCPQLCDGNPNGRRDAALQFDIATLPAGASGIRATLRVAAWQPFTARVVARGTPGPFASVALPLTGGALDTHDTVAAGYNEFDVSSVVTSNGSYTFSLSQETYNTRVYWGSSENTNASVRPQLVVSYEDTDGEPGDGWALAWHDEFDGTSPDRTKWNLRAEGRDVDLGCNTTNLRNTFVSGGTVTLRALRETATCAGQTRQYTESYLDTIGRASWTYGRFEIRAKSPNGPANSQGLWPAFWLRPNDGGHGEIDVTELPGGASWYSKSTAGIFYDYTPVKQDTRLAIPGGGHPGDGFHTYTTEWEPGVLRWYIDGVQVWQRDRTTTP